MGVTRPLSALGGTSLGDGHGTIVSEKVIRLTRRLVERAQRIPAGIAHRGATARPGIQVCSALRAQPLAVLPAHDQRGHGQQPLLTDRGTEVELILSCVDGIHIGVVLILATR